MDFLRKFLAYVVGFAGICAVIIAIGFFLDNSPVDLTIFAFVLCGAFARGAYWLFGVLWPTPPAPAPAAVSHRLDERDVEELARMAELILADDEVSQKEAELLQEWLETTEKARADKRTKPLFRAVLGSLSDGHLNTDEAEEIKTLLSEFCDNRAVEPEDDVAEKASAFVGLKEAVGDFRKGLKSAAQEAKNSYNQEVAKQRAAEEKKQRKAKTHKPFRPKLSSGKRRLHAGDEVYISYVDAYGEASERRVEVRSINRKNGRIYMNAICLTKHKFRSFRVDRIADMTRIDTGEYVANPYEYVSATL